MNATRTLASNWTSRTAMLAAVLLVGLSMTCADAEAARRFGGGKTFGRQSQNVTRQQTPPQDAAGQAQQGNAKPLQPSAAQPAPRPANRWLGPLAGIAAGLGIAALLSHFGLMGPFAEFLGSLIVIALLVFAAMFVWRMLRGNRAGAPIQRSMEPAYDIPGRTPDVPGRRREVQGGQRGSVMDELSSGSGAAGSLQPGAQWGVPADFDRDAFLRAAKTNFIRLQAAWDARDIADIHEFTSPEMFAELRMQMEEDAPSGARNDIVAVDAQLLGIETMPSDYLASVRFSGTLRDSKSGQSETFDEVWNLSKPKNGRSGWLVAGIQQLH
jgi:predicted lipid-binding transport protein (Tim44 family)